MIVVAQESIQQPDAPFGHYVGNATAQCLGKVFAGS